MRRAFTLIEILVVIVIIGILASVVLTSILPSTGKAKAAAQQTELSNLEIVIQQMATDGVEFPPGKDFGYKTQDDLDAKNPNKMDDSGNTKFFEIIGGKTRGQGGARSGSIKFNLDEARYIASTKDSKRKVFTDEFGNPFIYKNPGVKYPDGFDLYSPGINGLDDGGQGDDLMMKYPGG